VRFAGFDDALNCDATVTPLRGAAFRLDSHTFSELTSSTSRFDTTERGATFVTSTSAFANASRCLSSSHSFPLSEDFDDFDARPPIFTSAHSPNIFLPNIRNVSFPDFSAATGSSPGSMNSH
jgi:hypothetical protein